MQSKEWNEQKRIHLTSGVLNLLEHVAQLINNKVRGPPAVELLQLLAELSKQR